MISAFIFARGGSKGLPGKNLRKIGGKSLLQMAIESAFLLDSVTVSTDSREIEEEALAHGAHVLRRPAELCTDSAPEWLAWQHAVALRPPMELFVSLPCTTPLRATIDIEHTIEAMMNGVYDAAIAITPAKHNLVTLDINESILSGVSLRRQDLPPAYRVAGSVYVARREYIQKARGLFDGKVKGVLVPEARAIDIDTEHDLLMASLLMQNRNSCSTY